MDTVVGEIAPAGFTEEAMSENVIVGNAVGRHAVYMYGANITERPCSGVLPA